MRAYLGVFTWVGFMLAGSAWADQEPLGQALRSQKLSHQGENQRIVSAEMAERYTPEMLSERKVRKYRRPTVFKPIETKELATIKKRKAFVTDSN